MVKLDYPNKSKQSSKIKRQNKELKEKYKIAGYPNILLITRHGKAIGQIRGYRKGGVKNYIEQIERIINN
jgi:thioredoxin-related protein